ncbi:MAG: hypothetical protein BWX80_00583 [Candidatus Hydrogenedentes bacterium ADurb.Bin101]|nr:MAG: hypothetical protein BWX80_00583 [Candidatus Hydrogenedentes bacterium ADurb.Bin101]
MSGICHAPGVESRDCLDFQHGGYKKFIQGFMGVYMPALTDGDADRPAQGVPRSYRCVFQSGLTGDFRTRLAGHELRLRKRSGQKGDTNY